MHGGAQPAAPHGCRNPQPRCRPPRRSLRARDVRRVDREPVGRDSREVLDAGVQALELGEVVQRAVAVALDDGVQPLRDDVDVDEEPMLVEVGPS